jgi:hypothetical protein
MSEDISMVAEAIMKIKLLDLESFVRNFNNSEGFMWSNDSRITTIGNALDFQGHSGASFAITLRKCQHYFKDDFECKQKGVLSQKYEHGKINEIIMKY